MLVFIFHTVENMIVSSKILSPVVRDIPNRS